MDEFLRKQELETTRFKVPGWSPEAVAKARSQTDGHHLRASEGTELGLTAEHCWFHSLLDFFGVFVYAS